MLSNDNVQIFRFLQEHFYSHTLNNLIFGSKFIFLNYHKSLEFPPPIKVQS